MIILIRFIILEIFIIKIIGMRRVISTSKIKKITAIKKNCNENGNRADDFGSNPHSKGELFSRSINVFFERILARSIMIIVIQKIIMAIIKLVNIIYTNYLDLLIGSQI